MSKYFVLKISLFAFSLTVLLVACRAAPQTAPEPPQNSLTQVTLTDSQTERFEPSENSERLHYEFLNENTFMRFKNESAVYEINDPIIAGTVPHHLTAGSMISGFFAAAANSRGNVETVVIIAPMHDPRGLKICTTLKDWDAPSGVMQNDYEISETFVTQLGARADDAAVIRDHSAAALIPFAQHYFPEAKIAVLLISSLTDMAVADELTLLLAEIAGKKDCLFVFSVDFSHFLSPDETSLRDKETREAILSNDTDTISRMTNDNMDFPRGVITFLKLNVLLDLTLYELDHSNSLVLSGLPYNHPAFEEGLTSYFVFAAASE